MTLEYFVNQSIKGFVLVNVCGWWNRSSTKRPISLSGFLILDHRSAKSIHIRHSPLQQQFATSNHTMASAKPLTMLVARSRPAARLSSTVRPSFPAFSTTALRAATPSGPPPAGFRLPKPERWDESKESAFDKAGKYFLLGEMMRGMYVVLEQYFRPP